jgi:hypothetical protein
MESERGDRLGYSIPGMSVSVPFLVSGLLNLSLFRPIGRQKISLTRSVLGSVTCYVPFLRH